ncbi:DUF1127 domain-containing protein [Albirhodobacter sp. R86504]|jgi:uncharacterized protein YjiS (DUF1127 family)|uniref:DUF1127 domain-containing protein n=1 Tax=Albirhodobacter sp. R86504 TaxID=3093848 RepID=UPI00366A7AB1
MTAQEAQLKRKSPPMAMMTQSIALEHVSIAARIAAVFSKANDAWQQRRTIALLESLSDHELNDIGLSRGNIAQAVRGDL